MPQTTLCTTLPVSAHPPGCKRRFKSQVIHVCRNCFTLEDFDQLIEPVKMAYLSRGYPIVELNNIIDVYFYKETTVKFFTIKWFAPFRTILKTYLPGKSS